MISKKGAINNHALLYDGISGANLESLKLTGKSIVELPKTGVAPNQIINAEYADKGKNVINERIKSETNRAMSAEENINKRIDSLSEYLSDSLEANKLRSDDESLIIDRDFDGTDVSVNIDDVTIQQGEDNKLQTTLSIKKINNDNPDIAGEYELVDINENRHGDSIIVEVDKRVGNIIDSVGLNEDGSNPNEQRLSDQIKELYDRTDNNREDIDNLTDVIENVIQSSGLNEDGTYSPDITSNNINDAESLKDADSKLDKAIADEVNRATNKEKELQSNIDKETDRAEAKESELQSNIDAIENELNSEIKGLKIKKLEPISENIKESWVLVDKDDIQHGEIIHCFKDTSLKSVEKINEETVRFVYEHYNDDDQIVEETVDINFGTMIIESEIGDGLVVNSSTKVVSVRIDGTSEKYLTVSSNGVKLSGINEAISEVKSELNSKIEAETTRAKEAESQLKNSLSNVESDLNSKIDRTNNTISDVNKALNDEVTRAKNAESTLTTNVTNITNNFNSYKESNDKTIEELKEKDKSNESAIQNETTRATKREDELSSQINNTTSSLSNYVNDIKITGSGNVVTSVKKEGQILTFDKSINALTSHQPLDYINSLGKLNAQTGNTKPDSGLRLYQIYADTTGYPIGYGNLLSFKGTGSGQIAAEWYTGTVGEVGRLYYRSLRDNASDWSDWAKIAYTSDLKWDNVTGKPDVVSSSDLSNYVTLNTNQTITGQKTFGQSTRFQSSASGTGGDIGIELWRGTNASWRLLNTSGTLVFQNNYTTQVGDYFPVLELAYNTGNILQKKGSLTSNAFIKSGGTSSQFLKADGSVDSNTYLTSSSAASTYVKKSGDTMTGALDFRIGGETFGININSGYTRISSSREVIISNNVWTYDLSPNDTNKYSLGTEKYRWSNLYATTINVSSATLVANLNANYLEGHGSDWHRNNAMCFTLVSNSGPTLDANTQLNEGGILRNYTDAHYWVNAPQGFTFGEILTLHSFVNDTLAGQIAWDSNHNSATPTRGLYWRSRNSSNGWQNDWHQIAFTDSTVAKANQLATPRTLWGQSFDGSGNVDGDLTASKTTITEINIRAKNSVGDIALEVSSSGNRGIWDFTSSNWLISKRNTGEITIGTGGENVGIGTTSPSYKLHVSGTLYASGATTLASTLSVTGSATFGNTMTANCGFSLKNFLSSSLSQIGWYTVYTGTESNYNTHGNNVILNINRTYNNTNNETYSVAINGAWGGTTNFTQLSAAVNTQAIDKVRVVYVNSSSYIVQIHYNSTSINTVFINGIGNGIFQAPTRDDNPTGTPVEFELTKSGIATSGGAAFKDSILYKNDGTLKIYSIANPTQNSEFGPESVAIQTTFDGHDPEISTYPTTYPYRALLLLQPRGGNVAIGSLSSGDKLSVNGVIRSNTRVISPKLVYKASTSGNISLDAINYDLAIITLNGNVSGITLSAMPLVGNEFDVILYGNGTDRVVSIANSGSYVTSTGEALEIMVPANGYAEVNFLYDGSKVWVRGV